MRKWIVIIIVIVLGVLAYNHIYHDHRDIENESAEFIKESTDFSNEFAIDPSASERKYLNKTIEVKGTITEHNKSDLTLDDKVFCQFSSKIEVESGPVKVKGRFIGYDSLLEQVKLDQCTLSSDKK